MDNREILENLEDALSNLIARQIISKRSARKMIFFRFWRTWPIFWNAASATCTSLWKPLNRQSRTRLSANTGKR